MTPKNTFAILLFVIAGIFYYTFASAFKSEAVDPVSTQLDDLKAAYERATSQTRLKELRLKKQQLTEQNQSIIDNFVPKSLHSGNFVYNISQLANQNGLTLKGLQYTVIDDSATNPGAQKKLLIEMIVEGKYESFASWMQTLERSNILIDVESIRGVKSSNVGENITFTVKMYTYGLNID